MPFTASLKSLGAQLKDKLFASRDILAARLRWLSAEPFDLNTSAQTACPVPCGMQLFGIALPACRICCISVPRFYDVEESNRILPIATIASEALRANLHQ